MVQDEQPLTPQVPPGSSTEVVAAQISSSQPARAQALPCKLQNIQLVLSRAGSIFRPHGTRGVRVSYLPMSTQATLPSGRYLRHTRLISTSSRHA